MAFFMLQGRYTQGAIKNLMAKPEDRSKAAAAVAKACGGKLHRYYMSLGEYDFMAIMEFPNVESATAWRACQGHDHHEAADADRAHEGHGHGKFGRAVPAAAQGKVGFDRRPRGGTFPGPRSLEQNLIRQNRPDPVYPDRA